VQASYFVFEKMKVEGFAGYDDVRLKTAIKVPKAFVGRIIGKGGKTVRDIQHLSGVIIKLPSNTDDEAEEQDDGVFVTIYGSFIATQVSPLLYMPYKLVFKINHSLLTLEFDRDI